MTYSIVARDRGAMGVAVESHFFGVGRIVPWSRAGVGVVATQAFAEPAYGARGIELMAQGMSAPDALGALIAADGAASRRQVAMLDAMGAVAVHTGESCIAAAGHATGDGVSAQANMMWRDTVWDAMVRAFGATRGDLASRLLAALDAAEAEGGDIRGRQSAAPLAELRRLAELKRAYDRIERAEQLQAAGEAADAAAEFAAAQSALGANVEATFWHGVLLAAGGDVGGAREALEVAYRAHGGWAELVRRLPAAGLLPDDAVLLERLLAR